MERRELLKVVGLGVGFSALQAVLPGLAQAADKMAATANSDTTAMLNSASQCVKAGDACIAHCQREFAAGNKAMAECQKTVMNMVAVCEALAKLAAYNNAEESHIKAYAKVCASFCNDCAAACEKHASHHAVCKACLDSCKDCAGACEKYAA
jgi:Cys-rich four helix bundle protein (predicted Tat secretion target)